MTSYKFLSCFFLCLLMFMGGFCRTAQLSIGALEWMLCFTITTALCSLLVKDQPSGNHNVFDIQCTERLLFFFFAFFSPHTPCLWLSPDSYLQTSNMQQGCFLKCLHGLQRIFQIFDFATKFTHHLSFRDVTSKQPRLSKINVINYPPGHLSSQPKPKKFTRAKGIRLETLLPLYCLLLSAAITSSDRTIWTETLNTAKTKLQQQHKELITNFQLVTWRLSSQSHQIVIKLYHPVGFKVKFERTRQHGEHAHAKDLRTAYVQTKKKNRFSVRNLYSKHFLFLYNSLAVFSQV